MNKENSSKNLDYSIIDNTKEDDYEYIIDSKNILKIESTKKLNEEFGKYFGIQIDTSEEDIINQSTNSSMTNSVGNTNIDNNIQKLMFIFTEKLFPTCNLDGFQIIGLSMLKKSENESKICTFLINEEYRKKGYSKFMLEDSYEYLGTERPLITIPKKRLDEFSEIIESYGWVASETTDEYYSPEVIFNSPKVLKKNNSLVY